MSADRTLMSVIRTSLSLIGFGFTIFQVFEKLRQARTLSSAHAARNFGITLVALGIGMLVLGIIYHVQFMLGLRHVRHEMTEEGLIHGESRFPPSLTLITALILLIVGVAAIVSDGATIYRLNVKDVPVDGFWSISVYNAQSYFEKNPSEAYTLNNITAKRSADGSVGVQFGGCDGKVPNCLPIMPGWNYLVRLYRPRAEILRGQWTFPQPEPVEAGSRALQ